MLNFLRFNFFTELKIFSCAFLLFFGFGFYAEVFAQQSDVVDFLKIEASLTLNPVEKKVNGGVVVHFKILKDTDSIYLDAKNMKVVEDLINYDFNITTTEDKIWFYRRGMKAGEIHSTRFIYEALPKQTLYFFGDQIWTQGQGKYTSHWLPSIDDINDKIEFDLQIVAPSNSVVIANGKVKEIDGGFENYHEWSFDMKNPMSSYLVAFAIGDFKKKELISDSDIPIELYYKPSDLLKVEPTYRYSKRIFDFLEEEIGVAYPWQNYKQVPVRDFLYAGMENTTATFFSEAFIVDSTGFNDRNYINVNAHELAHQWFGNLITEKTSRDHWLQEGFATYYALLAEKEIFGDDYYYWQLYQTAEQLKASSDEGKGESLLNPKASSLTFYQKGAWALHILREKIGDEVFKTAIKNYLEKNKFKNVSNEDFIKEVQAVSELDISEFEKNWLQQTAFQSEEAYQSLLKSPFINKYFEISALRAIPLKDKEVQLKTALTFPNDFIGQEAVYQLVDESISETLPLYTSAFESNNLYVRQAVALSLETIPIELKNEYESLLNDDSYVTKEAALYQLWMQFPENRIQYLNKTKGVIGFQNKNVRQLWLALALITEEYENTNKVDYLNELKNYTSTDYSFEIRDKAFEYVNELQLWDSETLKNLVEACVHPTWRFSKSSRKLLNDLLANKKLQNQITGLGKFVSIEASNYLNSITKE